MTVQQASPIARSTTDIRANHDDVAMTTSAPTAFEVVQENDGIDYRNEKLLAALTKIQFNLIFMNMPDSKPPSTPQVLTPQSPATNPLPELELSVDCIDIPSLGGDLDNLDDLLPINLSF